MCELFGYCGPKKTVLNEELKTLFSHCDEHPNGWGIAIMDNDNHSIEKEPKKATSSIYLKERLKEPIAASHMLAHIRLATIGSTNYANSHPFHKVDISGRHWTFIHNGTIFHAPSLEKYVRVQNGSTDSERILLYFIDRINERTEQLGHPLDSSERFSVFNELCVELSPDNKLNLLIYDEEIMYAHTNFRDSLFSQKKDEGILFATVPLNNGTWENVCFAQAVAYKDGDEKFRGTAHGNEYIYDEEQMKLLFLAYSEL